jgi:hypothetical protein
MTARRVALAAWATCVVMAVPTTILLAVGPGRVLPSDIFAGVGGLAFLVLALAFASVGALVARRVPANRIGLVFCLTGLWNSVQLLTWQYADVGLHTTRLRGAAAAAILNTAISEASAGMLVLSLLLFPDGRLPSRRWGAALVGLLGGMALLTLAGTFHPGAYAEPFASVSNPFGIHGARGVLDAVDLVGWFLVIGAGALAAAAMIVRLKRARGVTRQQLKLVLAVGSVVGAVAVTVMATWLVWPHAHLQSRMAVLGIAFAAFPAAAGVAILRYRLFDIDVVINRTLVYVSATALLAGAYTAFVLLFQLVLSPLTSGNSLAVALSTLAVAALFRPARARVQALVDRRFYRSKYDAERTLRAFASRLRDEVELDALREELTTVIVETMQPAHVSLWLRETA